VKPLLKYSALVSGKDVGRTSPIDGPELIVKASAAVEDHARQKTRPAVELWSEEEEKALAHVHGLSRQHFIQLGANASHPTNRLTRARKFRVFIRFLRRAETSKKPFRFEAPLSNSGSSAAGSGYGGG
jgi:hypothetical protein